MRALISGRDEMSRVSKMRRVVVGIPEEMLSVLDSYAEENQSRSEIIREACSLFIKERSRSRMKERMKIGYQEMAEINRILAEEIACDFDCVPRDTVYANGRKC